MVNETIPTAQGIPATQPVNPVATVPPQPISQPQTPQMPQQNVPVQQIPAQAPQPVIPPQAPTQSEMAPQPNAPAKSSSKMVWVISSIILGVLVLAGASFFLFSGSSEQELTNSSNFSQFENNLENLSNGSEMPDPMMPLIDISMMLPQDQAYLRYFACLGNDPKTSCPEDNLQGYSGECVSTARCAGELNFSLNNLNASSDIPLEPLLNDIWKNCYLGNSSNPAVNGPSFSNTANESYISLETLNCWDGVA